MKLRSLVLLLAGFGIPVALIVMLLPIAWGYGGYNYTPQPDGTGVIVFLDPNGPAAKAGLRLGDRIIPPHGQAAVVEQSGGVGSLVHERVIRDGRPQTIAFSFVPFFGSLAVQEVFNKLALALTALGAFIVAILVIVRARDPRAGPRAAMVLLLAGAGALAQSASLVAGNAWAAFALATLLPPVLAGAGIWAALSLLAIYPPHRVALRRALSYAGPLALLWGLVGSYGWLRALSGLYPVVTLPRVNAAVDFVFDAIMCIAIVDAMAKAPASYAVPVRWLGGLWLLAIAFGASVDVGTAMGLPVIGHYGDILRAGTVFCLAFGVAYPVLRHRLVDLNILVSRATVFGIVSAIIVAIFIAAEYAVGKIFEESVGLSNDRRNLAAQLVTLGVVLILGISARSIHGFVEERLTKTFFRRRLEGIAAIERVAREADAATQPHAVLELGAHTVQRALEPLGTAFFLRSGELYERAASAGSQMFPASFDFNDAVPLRLRRWQEPFEVDDDSEDRHHMLYVPMTLRGELLGFLCCGPKPDRTKYLEDEIAALALLAHHTGLATAWLSRSATFASQFNDALPPLTAPS